MKIRLFDSELKIMDALWENGEIRAGELVKILNEKYGWNRNSTYSILKKCIEKGAVERKEPHFVCKALVTRDQIGYSKIEEILGRIFGNSFNNFFSCCFNHASLTEEEVKSLKEMVDKLAKEQTEEEKDKVKEGS